GGTGPEPTASASALADTPATTTAAHSSSSRRERGRRRRMFTTTRPCPRASERVTIQLSGAPCPLLKAPTLARAARAGTCGGRPCGGGDRPFARRTRYLPRAMVIAIVLTWAL